MTDTEFMAQLYRRAKYGAGHGGYVPLTVDDYVRWNELAKRRSATAVRHTLSRHKEPTITVASDEIREWVVIYQARIADSVAKRLKS